MANGRPYLSSCLFLIFCYLLRHIPTNYNNRCNFSPKIILNGSVNALQTPLNQQYDPESLCLLGPRGGHLVTQCRLQRVRYLSRRIGYYSNGPLHIIHLCINSYVVETLKPTQLRIRRYQARLKVRLENTNTRVNCVISR